MNPCFAAESPLNQEKDEVIWNAFRDKNKEAFAVIYYRFFNLLLHAGLQISTDKELVKDCIHDLFVEIWKNKSNLSTPLSVKAYLVVSIQRKIFRHMKTDRSRKNELDQLPVEVVHSREDQLISDQHLQDQKWLIIRAVNSLTPRQKEVIQLKFYNNLSYEEIAGMMKISTDSIYNLVSKAIDHLQQGLTKKAEPSLY